MNADPAWKLEELALRAKLSARTIRYYIQRGLLPPPSFRGRDTHYGMAHLHRLRAIRRLSEANWPLDAIASHLDAMEPAAIEWLADPKASVPQPFGQRDREQTPNTSLPDGKLPNPTGELPPAPRPRPTASHPNSPIRLQRFNLAPGLELTLDEDADETVQALARTVLALFVSQLGAKQ